MDDPLDFLAGDGPAESAAPAVKPEDSAPTDGPARGPDGKFAPKAAQEPATAPQEAAAPPAPAEPAAPIAAAPVAPATPPATAPDGYVPIAALQEVRNELKALKQAQQGPPPQAPDPIDDPDGYEAFHGQQVTAVRFELSKELALSKYGEELVNKAQEWAAQRSDTDRNFREASHAHPRPFDFAVQEYQRDQAIQFFADPKNLESFKAFQAGQTQAAPAQQAPPASPPPQSPVPPASLANAPNAGGTPPGAMPVYPGAVFDQVFS